MPSQAKSPRFPNPSQEPYSNTKTIVFFQFSKGCPWNPNYTYRLPLMLEDSPLAVACSGMRGLRLGLWTFRTGTHLFVLGGSGCYSLALFLLALLALFIDWCMSLRLRPHNGVTTIGIMAGNDETVEASSKCVVLGSSGTFVGTRCPYGMVVGGRVVVDDNIAVILQD